MVFKKSLLLKRELEDLIVKYQLHDQCGGTPPDLAARIMCMLLEERKAYIHDLGKKKI